MKNNHGGVLISFVILLPIIILVFGYVIEETSISYNKVRITSIVKEMINYSLDGYSKEDIISIYHQNNLDGDIEITYLDKGVNIKVKERIDSYLGNLLNNDDYALNISINGYKEDNKVIYEKG